MRFFFFNDTATTEIYTLSLHDALPICGSAPVGTDLGSRIAAALGAGQSVPARLAAKTAADVGADVGGVRLDRKSTRLNSSHANISYAVFCLKKKRTLFLVNRSAPRPIL